MTVSLAADLLARIDATAKPMRRSRSGVIEDWLRRSERAEAQARLDAEIEAYYTSLTPAEKAEDAEMARALHKAAVEALGASERGSRRRRRH